MNSKAINIISEVEDRKVGGVDTYAVNISTTAKCVCQYYIDGKLVAEYESAAEAMRITGINNSQIGRCCRGFLKTAGGYVWEYKGNSPRIKEVDSLEARMKKLSKQYYFTSRAKPVCQYQKDGTLVAEYESACEAERITGINHSRIGGCCKGSQESAGGFVWKFKH